MSCKNSDDRKIYRLAIDKKVMPAPPIAPPKVGDKTKKISQKNIDSIKNEPLKIAVNPYILSIENFDDDFNQLKNQAINLDYQISNIKVAQYYLDARPAIRFTVLPESKLSESETYKTFDGFLTLSEIKYNKSKDRAIVIVSYSVAENSNSTVLYLFEKINNNWVLIEIKGLSVS